MPSLSSTNTLYMEETKQMLNQSNDQNIFNLHRIQKLHSVSFMHKYNAADLISLFVALVMLIAGVFISNITFKCLCIVLAFVSLIIPALIRRVIERNSLSLDYVHKVLSEAGLNPIVTDGELLCKCNGKETVIRLYNGGVFQLYREYLISTKNNLDMYERAAATTTREVCTVKVGIRQNSDETGALIFSAESFCPSAKVFRQIYSGYMKALDIAEQRQGDNLRDFLSRDDKPRRKIGFITNHSN